MHLIDQQLNLMIRGRFDEGWRISQELEAMKHEMKGDGPLRHMFNRGWFLLNQGKLQEGFQHLEAGRYLNVYGNGRLQTTKPIWDGQSSLEGKTVLINLEAGIGDQIISSRFATEVMARGGRCIFVTHPTLFGLLQRIPGCSGCITLNEVTSTQHDYWIPGFSCSWLFGHDFDTLPREPYIMASEHSVKIWQQILKCKNRKPKIGIRWSGNPKFEHQQFRKFPPKKLIDLSHLDQFQFYSLQRDTDLYELPENVIDLQHLLISWEDTAACLKNLDLIITSCTSIAHLAGAMGLPTWVVIPILPYHIWAYGDRHSPWYQETTCVYRQTIFGEWDNVFAEIEQDLLEKFRFQPQTAMPDSDDSNQSEIVDPPPIQVPALQDIVNINGTDEQPTLEQLNDNTNA
jgi:hypothetical protein